MSDSRPEPDAALAQEREAFNAERNAFVVPVERLEVSLVLSDGSRHEVRLPRGPGQPIEELFESREPFVPALLPNGFRIFARSAIAAIVVPGKNDPVFEGLPQTSRAVRVQLQSGVVLEGELRFVPVVGRGRVTDILNEDSASFALHQGEHVQYVSKQHVLSIEER